MNPMVTVIYATAQPGVLSGLERITEEDLNELRSKLPKGTRELVDCDEDTLLFLHPTFSELTLIPLDDPTRLTFVGGLIPVVTQDEAGNILMQAFSSPESLALTRTDGFGTYYSRSRKSLWKKGDTSGHIQKVRQVLTSNDGDFVVYRVNQVGAACHEGYYSCFFRERVEQQLSRLPVPFLGKENA
ncbi:phosphoribosyl-AMP cyclohydrolase [Leptospira broomii serovar Hurstbridge str. 5399]|uniref:phosphoribosyl-AMP cyclohydrolase n=1 Tax=Leptospira broomii serovar Hurstbridge str. 5399 TaxID=1049789 RepID=T0FDM5_9LEPT|nr:phosphoribosyl-AMP cyclohydrolase [Leptospira broomii]EQA45697.1 phosphoribosyl-AMP cyclohydrolase [Leptospira broomii serovar Hurstbridge str. 5399]